MVLKTLMCGVMKIPLSANVFDHCKAFLETPYSTNGSRTEP
jgi:hypothetical protein